METELIPEQSNQLLYQLADNSYSREEVIEIAKGSLDFLAAMAMPTVYQYSYPPVFLAVWQWLCSYADLQRDFSKLALGLPRGFSKTTVAKLFVLWLVLFSKKQFILIFGSNDDKAEEFLADVCDMLDEPNIKRTFGDWRLGLVKDEAATKKFTFRGRDIILGASGPKGSVRGKNIKKLRPDVIIFDDIQTKEQAESNTESDSIYRWLFATALKLKSPHGCLYLFIANMYPTPNSILRKLKGLSNWVKFISGAILEDGSSIWQELQPIEQLLEEFRSDNEAGLGEIFKAEVMNDEDAQVMNKLDITKIVPTHFNLTFPPEGKYILIDLATDKPKANNTVIGLVYVYSGVPVLMSVEQGIMSPKTTIMKCIELAQREGVQLICPEDGAYQSTFQFWFNEVQESIGLIGIELRGVRTKGIQKNTRIREAFKKLIAGDIALAPAVRNVVASQYAAWNPMKKDNEDDLLDIVGYLDQPLLEYSDAIAYDIIDEASQRRMYSLESDVIPAAFNCSF